MKLRLNRYGSKALKNSILVLDLALSTLCGRQIVVTRVGFLRASRDFQVALCFLE